MSQATYPLSVEIIAEAQSCDDALGKAPDLLAQSRDVDVDRTVQHKHILRPHLVDELLAGKHTSFLLKQKMEQLKLGLGKGYILTVDAHRLLVEVHLQSLITQHGRF